MRILSVIYINVSRGKVYDCPSESVCYSRTEDNADATVL
jgi:hypothetical protein